MIKLLLIAFTIILVSGERSLPYSEQDHIINMGFPTWQQATKDFEEGLLVYFYHNLCTPCKVVFPEIQNAAIQLSALQSAVQFAKIECHDEIGLCQTLHVSEFPTLILYRAERPPVEYRGLKKSQAITTWVRKVIDSDYERFSQEKQLFKRFSTAILLNDRIPEEVNNAYKDLIQDVEIGKATGQLAQLVNGVAGVIYSQGGKPEIFQIDEKHDAEWLRGRVRQILYKEKSAVPNFSEGHWRMLQYEGDRDFVLFFRTNKFDPISDATKAYDNIASQKSNDTLVFTYLNTEEVIGDTVANMFGVSTSNEPTIGILSKKGRILRKYKLDAKAKITEESINALLTDFENGQQRYYASAPLSKIKKGYIQDLVGNNFKTVTNSGKNVLVLFYFQRDIFSAQFDNMWETLAYRFRGNPDVVVARIDMALNDVEGVEFENYPVVRLYTSNSNSIDYTASSIEINGVKNFLLENVPGLETEIEL